MTIKQQRQVIKDALSSLSDTPLLEADILLAHALQVERSFLYAWPDHLIADAQIRVLNNYVCRRLNHEPIAYIIGYKEFWSLNLSINDQVLVPRPETEHIIEYVLKLRGQEPYLKIADLGTGSGAIALALAHTCQTWQVHATDISAESLTIAKQNAQCLNISNITFHQGDWCQGLPDTTFDIIISNPPYIAESEWTLYESELMHEPKLALLSGQDGLQAIHQIIPSAKQFLTPQGCLLIEHGFAQGKAVRRIFAEAGYDFCHSIKDLAGHERITEGRLFTR